MKLRICAVLFAALALLASPALGQNCYTNTTNLVVNCGFETGDFTGWNTIPATYGSLFFVTGFGYQSNYSAAFGAVDPGYYDEIYQFLPAIPGHNYYVDFELTNYGSSNMDFLAVWDGSIIYEAPFNSFGWTDVRIPVTAGGGDYLLFASYNVPSFYYLDNVSVGTPEPGSLILMGTGLLGLAGVVRRKFNF